MSALVLDAGALIAVDQNNRAVLAQLRVAQQHGIDVRTNANVVAQVWRDPGGRQANLARLLDAVDVRPTDAWAGREAGVLLGLADLTDVVDATLVLIASSGDRIVTSDPDDVGRLAAAANVPVVLVPC